jgi:hypothetical protein
MDNLRGKRAREDEGLLLDDETQPRTHVCLTEEQLARIEKNR